MKKKRWTLKLALCLLAGAVVTWGVAWACALWSPLGTAGDAMLHGSAADRIAESAGLTPFDGAFTNSELRSEGLKGMGVRVESRSYTGESKGSFETYPRFYWDDLVSGYPLSALSGRRVLSGNPAFNTAARPPKFLGAADADRTLPTRILPLGFALNTLFYAAVLLGAVECVAFARRRVRRGKGRCPSCGYDRAGLAEGAACPECGGNDRRNEGSMAS